MLSTYMVTPTSTGGPARQHTVYPRYSKTKSSETCPWPARRRQHRTANSSRLTHVCTRTSVASYHMYVTGMVGTTIINTVIDTEIIQARPVCSVVISSEERERECRDLQASRGICSVRRGRQGTRGSPARHLDFGQWLEKLREGTVRGKQGRYNPLTQIMKKDVITH